MLGLVVGYWKSYNFVCFVFGIVNFINQGFFLLCMKIIVVEDKANKLVFEIEGADHTFCNALKDELRNDEGIVVSAYNISHPLVGKPKFFVETKKGTKAKDALGKAVDELKKKNSAFFKAFKSL